MAKESSEGEEDSVGGSTRPHSLKSPWENHTICNVEGFDRSVPKQKVLTDLFQNSSDHRKLALKDKLRKIKMEKGDSIPKYLTKFV